MGPRDGPHVSEKSKVSEPCRDSSPGSNHQIISIFLDYKKKKLGRKILGELNILSLYSQYLFSLLCFIINNKDRYTRSLDVHGRNNSCGLNLHPPASNRGLIKKALSIWT